MRQLDVLDANGDWNLNADFKWVHCDTPIHVPIHDSVYTILSTSYDVKHCVIIASRKFAGHGNLIIDGWKYNCYSCNSRPVTHTIAMNGEDYIKHLCSKCHKLVSSVKKRYGVGYNVYVHEKYLVHTTAWYTSLREKHISRWPEINACSNLHIKTYFDVHAWRLMTIRDWIIECEYPQEIFWLIITMYVL